MLDFVSYQKTIIDIRTTLTDYKIGGGGSEPAKTIPTGYRVFTIDDSDFPLKIVYQLHDLYIQGWYNKSQQLFLHKNSGYSITAGKKFRYSNDYGELGYSQSTDTINLDLNGVNGALAAAYNAKTTDPDDDYKRVFVNLAIAFAEAVRFSDVMYKIIKGLPITDVSWTDHKDKSAVMVVKS